VNTAVANPNAIANVMYVSTSGVTLFFPSSRAGATVLNLLFVSLFYKSLLFLGGFYKLVSDITALSISEVPRQSAS
jgi:hypothetical protein